MAAKNVKNKRRPYFLTSNEVSPTFANALCCSIDSGGIDDPENTFNPNKTPPKSRLMKVKQSSKETKYTSTKNTKRAPLILHNKHNKHNDRFHSQKINYNKYDIEPPTKKQKK
eukprot:40614_1